MPQWLRKVIVVSITIFTLGLVSPPTNFLAAPTSSSSRTDVVKTETKQAVSNNHIHSVVEEISIEPDFQLPWPEIAADLAAEESIQAYFIDYSNYHLENQAMLKFGERISERIGEQFTKEIKPNVQKAIESFTENLNVEDIPYLTISDQPSSGYGEKIFHIYDNRDGADRFRFHVRREHPPQSGFWFSFHYHTAEDQFRTHHELGKIYWDKNTPPKWMA